MAKWKLLVVPLVIVAIAVTACSPKRVPEIKEAKSAIKAAKDAGAEKYAPTKLRAAEEALSEAQAARQDRNYSEAVSQAKLAKKLANEARAMALEAAQKEAAEMAEEQPEEETIDYDKIFPTVYFDFDKSNIKEKYRTDLNEAASAIMGKTGVTIKITGYCDPRGTDEYNMALGERRANSVKDYLVNHGVPASRIETVSKGENAPLNPDCSSESCWWKERRAVITVE